MKIDAIVAAFGARAFSLKEATVAFGPTIRSDLSRLVLDGRLERVGRGTYRIAEPGRRVAIAKTRGNLLRDVAVRAPFRVALDGPDAVHAWTGGRFTLGEARMDPILYLAVDSRDETAFRAWLEANRWFVASGGFVPATQGPIAILRVVRGLKRTTLDGVPVITKSAVRRILKAPVYEGAREWLLEG